MIIPPDPEKDPRLFAESRASLVTTEGELIDLADFDGPQIPGLAYHPPGVYPHDASPFTDEFAVYPTEALPPYEGRRTSGAASPNPQRRSMRNSGLAMTPATGSSTSLTRSRSAQSSSSSGSSSSRRSFGALLSTRRTASVPPFTDVISPTATAVAQDDFNGEHSKLWEGLVMERTGKEKWCGIRLPGRPRVPVSPEMRQFWTKHRRWIIIIAFVVGGLVLVAVGLIAGFMTASKTHTKQAAGGRPYRGDKPPPNNTVQTGNLTITYVPDRDGPVPADGTPFNCNNFHALNTSSLLSQLSVNNPFFDHIVTTFTWPLDATYLGMPSLSAPFYFIGSGLATSGTVEFIGTNAPLAVIQGGTEGEIQMDILVRVPKNRTIESLARVCQLAREDGSMGVGIYTPIQTDNGQAAPYLLNPVETPGFHTVVRLPPSAVLNGTTPRVYLPNVSLDLSQMGVRVGDLQEVALFGHLDVNANCRGGGIVVSSLSAEAVSIGGAEGTVQGVFNISDSLNINSTSGTILADVILHNPSDPTENSTTLSSGISNLRRRGYSTGDLPPLSQWKYGQYQADGVLEPNHTVTTNFITNEGFIFVNFLHHPPSSALQAVVQSQSGIVDIAMHPNFVGPYALENLWGAIRLPAITTPNDLVDPLDQGRTRFATQGPIDFTNSSFFNDCPLFQTQATAATSVTGAAFWAHPRSVLPTARDVQWAPEGRGSGLIAFANLGDLEVTFDGT